MQVTVLMAFVLCLVLVAPGALDELMPPGWQTVSALGVYLFGTVGIAAAGTGIGMRKIAKAGAVTPAALHLHSLSAVATRLWLVAGLCAAVYSGYGRWVMGDLGLASVPLVGRLLVVAPFIAALLLAWVTGYPFYRVVRQWFLASQATGPPTRRPWTLGQYLSYNCRHHLLFILVPLSLIILAHDLLLLYAWPKLGGSAAGECVILAGIAASALTVFFIAPVIVVHIWRTERLGDRPLRRGLEEMSRRLKLRWRDILIWKSDGMIANAGVMGLAGPVRYVLLSDGLLENLDHRQVEAVFAHEAGHIASHHIVYSAMFVAATSVICTFAGALLGGLMGLGELHSAMATLGLLIPAWALGFGWISRRFERQSDVIAAWAVGQPLRGDPPPEDRGPEDEGRITPEGSAVCARALERIARLNGTPAGQRSWRHGSIAGRVSYLLWLGSTGGSRRAIDRVVRRIKLAIWLLLACAAALTVLLQIWSQVQQEV